MDINLKLTIDEVNYILNAVAARPYSEVKDLVAKIQKNGAEEVAKLQSLEAGSLDSAPTEAVN
jgi:predicted DNA-binding ArsR family transcriptional regulator